MSSAFRVAMVAACPFPAARGTPLRIQRMAEVLGQRGHEVHLVTYHLGDPLPAAPPYRLHRTRRVPTYQKQSPGPTLQKLLVVDSVLARLLWRVLREHRIDLIHAHHYEGLLVARLAAGRLGHPIIYDAHTLLGTELGHYVPGPLRGIAARTGKWLDRILPPRADHVISVSQAIRDHLVATGAMAADRIAVIGNGVEQDHFDVGNGARAEGEQLIFTGNLAPYQGIDLLLQSFREVRALRRGVRLVIVTDSPFDPYEALARELGVRDAIELRPASFATLPHDLAQARVAVNPRILCHGIPLKLLNYMSAGKPIVSFQGSGHGLEHGRTALVVPDGDTSAFARAVVQLLEHPDLAARLGDNARRHSREHHSWTGTAVKIERVYERLMAGRSAP